MKKSILSIGKPLNKAEQKQISGGFLTLPGCCVCIFRPANLPYQVIITQSCALECPADGAFSYSGSGC